MLQELNEDVLDWKLSTFDHVCEIITFFFSAIVSEFKSIAIEELIVQLVDDLKSTFLDSLIDVRNL